MIVTLFTYILLGLSLSIPAGAMTVQMTKQGIRGSGAKIKQKRIKRIYS
ncbi:hypothetical protein ABH946_004687 [Bacillus sp. RC145]|nr:hypothetical protein [Bacillus mycoides]MED0890481.1 hypothetical protein [Bacillus mycoides]MED0929836.1 hypothetical protein [Bacillus mycoides]MED1630875.1 hypothetical protein [Bacillus mycoides]